MMLSWKRRNLWMLAVIIMIVGLVTPIIMLLIHQSVVAAGKGRIFRLTDNDIPHAQVALVLGAKVYKNGSLSPMLADRVDVAIQLYKRGVVEKLLMSGDNRSQNYNEVTAMRDYAIEHGVPSDDVIRDFAGFRTYDSVYRAKELWDLDRMLIVSQRFHLSRAIYIARKLDVEAFGIVAEGRVYPSSLRRASRREIGARLLAWVDVLIGRDPYFLGPKEGLSGDAQETRVPE